MNDDQLHTDLTLLSGDLPDLHAVTAAVALRVAARSRRRRGAALFAVAAAVVAVTVGTVAIAQSSTAEPAIQPPAATTTSGVTHPSPHPAAPATGSHPSAPAAANPTVAGAAQNVLLIGANSAPSTDLDSATVVHISADQQHVAVLSIPEDLGIPTPTCRQWNADTGTLTDKTVPISADQHFTVSTSYGVGGPQCTTTAVQALTGLHIDRVVRTEFSGFQHLVDAVGGLDIDACSPVVDRNIGTIVAAAGQQHIDGSVALSLVRARNIVGETGTENDRIHREQGIFAAIVRQTAGSGTATDSSKIRTMMKAIEKDMTTVAGSESSLGLAETLSGVSPGQVLFYTLPNQATATSSTLNAAAAHQLTAAIGADQTPPAALNAAADTCVGAPATH